MSRKGENIRKRSDGRWEARYIRGRDTDGKALYGYLYASSYKEAKEKKINAMQVNWGKQEDTLHQQKVSFSVIAMDWIKIKETRVKASTLQKYEYVIKKYLIPNFHMEDMSKLKTKDLDMLYKNIYHGTGSGELAPSTMRTIMYIVNAVLRYGRTFTDIPEVNSNFELPFNRQNEISILTSEEENKLFLFLQSHPSLPHLGIAICLYTGLRLGEICALKISDIDLSNNTISVNKTAQRIHIDSQGIKTRLVIDTPKSAKSVRTIPIPSFLAELLWENSIQGHKDDFYLLSANREVFEPRTLQNYFKRALEWLDIPERNFHCLRHTFASNCVRLGFDVKTLSEILGHSDVSITLNKYVHIDLETKRTQMELFSLKKG